jgi:hypothetical protein
LYSIGEDMKILNNITATVQFLRIEHSPVYAYSKKAKAGGMIELTDLEYSLVYDELDPEVWSVTVIEDPNEAEEGIPSGTLHSNLTYNLNEYIDDAAAALAGVPEGTLYHTGGIVKVKL